MTDRVVELKPKKRLQALLEKVMAEMPPDATFVKACTIENGTPERGLKERGGRIEIFVPGGGEFRAGALQGYERIRKTLSDVRVIEASFTEKNQMEWEYHLVFLFDWDTRDAIWVDELEE